MTTTSGDASRLREFVFVTGNKNKLREVQQILGDHIQSASLDLEEIQGDARDIVRRKAMLAASHLERVVLVEDVSLCITALGGLPGPYIKWFVDKLGPAGLARMLVGFDDKSAEAHCTFALCAPNEEPIIFVGRCPGRIVDAPRSAPDNLHPFGFDPIFQPDGFDLTYAELPSATKTRFRIEAALFNCSSNSLPQHRLLFNRKFLRSLLHHHHHRRNCHHHG